MNDVELYKAETEQLDREQRTQIQREAVGINMQRLTEINRHYAQLHYALYEKYVKHQSTEQAMQY